MIDIFALLTVLLNEQHKPDIVEATKGHDLQAPFSLDAEVGNALYCRYLNEGIYVVPSATKIG